MMSSRLYPASFRSPLVKPSRGGPLPPLPSSLELKVKCQCGDVDFEVPLDASRPPAILRCHCRGCRRFHASSFAALLPLNHVPETLVSERTTRSFESPCDGLSCKAMSRLFCQRCKSVLGAIPSAGASGDATLAAAYLAMGCVSDEFIPPSLALAWQQAGATGYRQLSTPEGDGPMHGPHWWTARPSGRPPTAPPRTLRGRCACGACVFTAQSGSEFQTQHCYCNLCRRMSGSVAQTWVPCRPNGFVWEAGETSASSDVGSSALELVRTTAHGQRHMCRRCGTTLTIVYDSQPDCIWPVAGVLDDDSLPQDLEKALCRSIHICCSMMQPWCVPWLNAFCFSRLRLGSHPVAPHETTLLRVLSPVSRAFVHRIAQVRAAR